MRKILFIPSVLFILIAILILLFYKSETELLIEGVRNQKVVLKQPELFVDSILNELTLNTVFENKFAINKTIEAGNLNILFVDIDSSIKNGIKLQGLKNNCGYLGKANLIICDYEFGNNFLKSKGVLKYYESNAMWHERKALSQRIFLQWVLGHEIGHILLKHKAKHFKEDQLNQEVANENILHSDELEADSFFVSKVIQNDKIEIALTSILIDILNCEIRNKVGNIDAIGNGIIFDYSNQKMVEYTNLQTHPEFVIRASRILMLIGNKPDREGVKFMTQTFIRNLIEIEE